MMNTVSGIAGNCPASVLRTPAAVERVMASWDAVPGATDPVGGGAWVRAWLDAYGARYHLAVVVAGPPGAPEAVLPLVRHRSRPWFLEMLGVRELAEATDVRAASAEALAAIAGTLLGMRTPLRFRRLPAGSPLIEHLRAAAHGRALVLSRAVLGTPTIALDPSWLRPESHFSSRRGQDFRADRRRAEKLGTVELAVEAPGTAGEVDRLFEEFVAVESRGWKREAGTALAVQPAMHDFFRRFGHSMAEVRALRVAVLRIGGRAAAMQFGVERDGRYSLFKIGFDEEFARCSPGMLLMLHTVAWAAGRGLASYEFLGAEEPWTRIWTTTCRPCVEVHVYPLAAWSLPAAGEVALELGRRLVHTRPARHRATVARAAATSSTRERVRRVLAPVISRAGSAFLAGRSRADAVAAARELADLGYGVSLAYWNGPGDSAADVERELLGCIADLAGRPGSPQVAVKAPTFGFDPAVVGRLAAAARQAGVALVFDAHAPEDADRTLALAAIARKAGAEAGVALPARWRRSRTDAEAAVAAGLGIRLVKGQWPEEGGLADAGEESLRASARDLLGALAGQQASVALATHDADLLAELIDRGPGRGERSVELLLGLPAARPLQVAARRGLPVRFYIAYGSPSLAFRISSVVGRPRLAVTLAEGFLRGAANGRRRLEEALAARRPMDS